MHQAQLEITKSGQTGQLVIGTGKYHFWHLDSPLSWLPASSGTWSRRVNATKFRQFSYLELQDSIGKGVARLPEQPYAQGDRIQGSLIDRWWVFETSGDPFDVTVKSSPPLKKPFRLRESWGGALSYVVGQYEIIGIEIVNVATNTITSYVYKGSGLSLGPPIKKLPNVLPGLSTSGPWNDFDAPGWMLADDFEGDATMQAANLGFATTISKSCFEFAGHVDNFPGFWAKIPDLQTGRTIGLPSAGFSSGQMKAVTKAAPFSPN